MAVKYLRRAQEGATVGAPGAGLGSLFGGLAGGGAAAPQAGAPAVGATGPIPTTADELIALQNEMSELQNAQAMIELLAGIDQFMGGGGEGGIAPGTQLDAAQMQANSVPPGAQFTPGLNPGGLADALSQFVQMTGAPGFGLEEGSRLVNRVPFSISGQSAGGGDPAIRAAIMAIAQPLIDQALTTPDKKLAGEAAAAGAPGATSTGTSVKRLGKTGPTPEEQFENLNLGGGLSSFTDAAGSNLQSVLQQILGAVMQHGGPSGTPSIPRPNVPRVRP
jgi:hypothetical protein